MQLCAKPNDHMIQKWFLTNLTKCDLIQDNNRKSVNLILEEIDKYFEIEPNDQTKYTTWVDSLLPKHPIKQIHIFKMFLFEIFHQTPWSNFQIQLNSTQIHS